MWTIYIYLNSSIEYLLPKTRKRLFFGCLVEKLFRFLRRSGQALMMSPLMGWGGRRNASKEVKIYEYFENSTTVPKIIASTVFATISPDIYGLVTWYAQLHQVESKKLTGKRGLPVVQAAAVIALVPRWGRACVLARLWCECVVVVKWRGSEP